MEEPTYPDSPDSSYPLCIICNTECNEKQKNPPEDSWEKFKESAIAWKEINGVYIWKCISECQLRMWRYVILLV